MELKPLEDGGKEESQANIKRRFNNEK